VRGRPARRLPGAQRRGNSVQFINMFPAVGRIANQRSAAEVNHEIQAFQGQLADQDGHLVRDLRDVHRATPPPDGQPNDLVEGRLGDTHAAADLLG